MKTVFPLLGALAALPAAAHAANKVNIEQIGSGNRVEIRQSSGNGNEDESTILQQQVVDENGNSALVIQQGNTNISSFTQRGQLDNVVNTGEVVAPKKKKPDASEKPYEWDEKPQ